MKFNKTQLKLYAITDRSWLKGHTLAEQVEQAILGGVTMVQFREKKLSYEEMLPLAKSVQAVCKQYGVPFLVNDYVELAKELDADGVHVGQSDLAVRQARAILGQDKIIGATAKTVEQAKEAVLQGADYLGSGAVFGSATKTDAKPMKRELLQEICHSVSIPVMAIGGITADNMEGLAGCEIAGVAVISGIFSAPDIKQTAEDFRKKLVAI